MCSCSTKTWNVIQFNLIKGTGPRSLECNLIQINKTDWVYPMGPAASHSDSVSHSENAAVSFAPKSPAKIALLFSLFSLVLIMKFWIPPG